MADTLQDLTAYLLDRLRLVQGKLGLDAGQTGPDSCFADAVDSMGMVEFLAVVAEDCGVSSAAVEECAGRRFGTVAELALALQKAGTIPHRAPGGVAASVAAVAPSAVPSDLRRTSWLGAVAIRLPRSTQSAASIDEALHRPRGWLESHAGIHERRIWADEDALAGAAEVGRECLERAGLLAKDVDALLVTSEAPPLLVGLAAAIHHRLHLRPTAVALEVGGECTGFLTALWLARELQHRTGAVLAVAVEAPSAFCDLSPARQARQPRSSAMPPPVPFFVRIRPVRTAFN
jgi:hypothetical protein